jgi:hypothetical protein
MCALCYLPGVSSQGDVSALFRVGDYEGTVVECSVGAWQSKVVRDHPEIEGREREVESAVVDPEIVLQDRDYPDRKHHIRRTPDGLYLKVVAAYAYMDGVAEGTVVTAFLQSRLRRGDTILYVRARG